MGSAVYENCFQGPACFREEGGATSSKSSDEEQRGICVPPPAPEIHEGLVVLGRPGNSTPLEGSGFRWNSGRQKVKGNF